MQIKIGMQLENIKSGIIHEVVASPGPDKWILASDRGSRAEVFTSDIEALFNIVSTPVVKFHVGRHYRQTNRGVLWCCADASRANGEVLFKRNINNNQEYYAGSIHDTAGWIEVIKSETQTEVKEHSSMTINVNHLKVHDCVYHYAGSNIFAGFVTELPSKIQWERVYKVFRGKLTCETTNALSEKLRCDEPTYLTTNMLYFGSATTLEEVKALIECRGVRIVAEEATDKPTDKPVTEFIIGKTYRNTESGNVWKVNKLDHTDRYQLTQITGHSPGCCFYIHKKSIKIKAHWVLVEDMDAGFKISSYNGIKTVAIKAAQENNMHKPQIGDRYRRLCDSDVYEVTNISNDGDLFTIQAGSGSTCRTLAELTHTGYWEYIPAKSETKPTNPTQKEEKHMAAFNFNEVFEQLKSGAKEGTALALDEVVTEMVLSRFKDQMPLLQLPGAKTVALYVVPLGLWAASYLIESDYSSKVRTVTLMAVRAQTSRLIASFGPQLKEIFQEISKLDTE